ncbi:sulfotransferase family protein [Flexivirga sp.]|uniref:sulfotransferase family protein n=1 Tax=Flexivirga sp. TaxID=1962927 RepID=UPI003F7D9390
MSDPVIIVGAPRSGTNMLRDVLSALTGFATWDCDEINLIWKHGNIGVPHDELTAEDARPEVATYLRKAFADFGRKHRADVVVEKTCATSLRVGFVAAALPDARYVFIRRDGIDATASAIKRWNAPFDLRYTLKKVRYVPARDFPVHFASFVGKKVKQLRTGTAGIADGQTKVETWWGPRPHDFRELMQQHTLEEAAFIQWQRCVERSREDFNSLPDDRMIEVVYEDFVKDPDAGLREILGFLGRDDAYDPTATKNVRNSSVGKGRATLGSDVTARLDAIGHDTLAALGYA